MLPSVSMFAYKMPQQAMVPAHLCSMSCWLYLHASSVSMFAYKMPQHAMVPAHLCSLSSSLKANLPNEQLSSLEANCQINPDGPCVDMQVCLVLQILKHTSSSGGAAATPAPLDSGSQLFPFGDEYTSGDTTSSKVPPFRKAAHDETAAYDQKVDIWAVGCLMFELLTGAWMPSHCLMQPISYSKQCCN